MNQQLVGPILYPPQATVTEILLSKALDEEQQRVVELNRRMGDLVEENNLLKTVNESLNSNVNALAERQFEIRDTLQKNKEAMDNMRREVDLRTLNVCVDYTSTFVRDFVERYDHLNEAKFERERELAVKELKTEYDRQNREMKDVMEENRLLKIAMNRKNQRIGKLFKNSMVKCSKSDVKNPRHGNRKSCKNCCSQSSSSGEVQGDAAGTSTEVGNCNLRSRD